MKKICRYKCKLAKQNIHSRKRLRIYQKYQNYQGHWNEKYPFIIKADEATNSGNISGATQQVDSGRWTSGKNEQAKMGVSW